MGTYNILPVFSVGESRADGLIYVKDVCDFIPRMWVKGSLVFSRDSAWPFITFRVRRMALVSRRVEINGSTS